MQRLIRPWSLRSLSLAYAEFKVKRQWRWLLLSGYFVLIPVTVYALIVSIVTWPLVTQLSTHLPGSLSITDSIEHLRLIWWVKYALQHSLNPFYQSLFGYPDGFFSTVQWSQPLVYGPPALLNMFMTPVTALNLWLITVLILDGLTGFWLCLALLLIKALNSSRPAPPRYWVG